LHWLWVLGFAWQQFLDGTDLVVGVFCRTDGLKAGRYMSRCRKGWCVLYLNCSCLAKARASILRFGETCLPRAVQQRTRPWRAVWRGFGAQCGCFILVLLL
jgi:hypothetical protein